MDYNENWFGIDFSLIWLADLSNIIYYTRMEWNDIVSSDLVFYVVLYPNVSDKIRSIL